MWPGGAATVATASFAASAVPATTLASAAFAMVHVAPGSRPPSWSQNEVKVLIDAESSLFIATPEKPGPGLARKLDPPGGTSD